MRGRNVVMEMPKRPDPVSLPGMIHPGLTGYKQVKKDSGTLVKPICAPSATSRGRTFVENRSKFRLFPVKTADAG
jgi:hypothetical protein